MSRARDEEASHMEQERGARRELEINKREWDKASAEYKAKQQQAREQDGELADELMELQAKHVLVRRKLEDGAAELTEQVNVINGEIKAQRAKNIEDERVLRLNERSTRDATRGYNMASLKAQD